MATPAEEVKIEFDKRPYLEVPGRSSCRAWTRSSWPTASRAPSPPSNSASCARSCWVCGFHAAQDDHGDERTDTEGKTLVSTTWHGALTRPQQLRASRRCRPSEPVTQPLVRLQSGRASRLLTAGAASRSFSSRRTSTSSRSSERLLQSNPVELIGSKKMESLVREMRERYSDRYIIFDSSPLLATTEPSVLTRLVDGIILVIRAGVTPARRCSRRLPP